MQNDVVGLDSIAESCRKMFEQTQNKAFKREGRRIYTASIGICSVQDNGKLTVIPFRQ